MYIRECFHCLHQIFKAGSGSASVTQEVKARKGFLFNGTYDNELNFHNPLKINVFDTPGFADADLNNLRKNKLLIGTSLKMNIHLVLFVQALILNPKLNSKVYLKFTIAPEKAKFRLVPYGTIYIRISAIWHTSILNSYIDLKNPKISSLSLKRLRRDLMQMSRIC